MDWNQRAKAVAAVPAIILCHVTQYSEWVMFQSGGWTGRTFMFATLTHLLGIVVSALLLPVLLPLRNVDGELVLVPGRLRRHLPLLVVLAAAACQIVGFSGMFGRVGAVYLSTTALGLMIPTVYSYFFTVVPVNRQGVCFGLAIASGVMYWRICTGAELSSGILPVVHNLMFAGLLAAVAYGYSWGEFVIPAWGMPRKNAGRNIVLILAAVGIYFLLNGFLGGRLFIAQNTAASGYWPLGVTVIVVCTLTGWALDRRKTYYYRRFAVLWSLLVMLASSLAVLAESPALFWTVHSFAVVGQIMMFVGMSIILAGYAGGVWFGLIFSSASIVRLLSIVGQELYLKNADLNRGIIVFISIVAGMAFYALVIKIQPYEGPEKAAPEPEDAAANGDAAPAAAIFADHGLTPRETEVALCIMKGASTRDMAEELGISENTVKIHVRNVLGKFGVSSRKAFLAAIIAVKNK